jgi:hypothetical protein
MKRKLPAAVSAAGCLRRREEAPVKYVRGFFFALGFAARISWAGRILSP